ncbi:DNA-binding protein H-NS [Litoreibacter ponti]|uniref:DNA-binding protein H-NS n=1 Tax=Litoreibacter ponti TaxID=1510457 RepID=A0A2T6BN73_9RHOB|nr:H-NS histone family protein [Litoreibacter ponti]PTX57515.1 DNA-binding protein H-NS [Litoreibacter ponti]
MSKVDLKSLTLSELKSLRTRVEGAIARHEKKKKSEALAAVKAKAKEMGFSLEELAGAKKDAPKTAKKSKPKSVPRKPTHRHPDDASKTWSGRGARPKWLKEELASGKQLSDFAV